MNEKEYILGKKEGVVEITIPENALEKRCFNVITIKMKETGEKISFLNK